jgi:hypothetical protein
MTLMAPGSGMGEVGSGWRVAGGGRRIVAEIMTSVNIIVWTLSLGWPPRRDLTMQKFLTYTSLESLPLWQIQNINYLDNHVTNNDTFYSYTYYCTSSSGKEIWKSYPVQYSDSVLSTLKTDQNPIISIK